MTEILLTRDLVRRPLHPSEIARMSRRGELIHVRRGGWSTSEAPDPRHRHRQLIAATVGQISPDAVLSHVSAGLLHGLPLWDDQLGQVHWTRSREGGGRSGRQVHVYGAPIGRHEIVVRDGIPITSIERTVVDLARHLPFEQGVAAADAALRLGVDRQSLIDTIDLAPRRPGNGRARRVVGFADGRAETAGESWSRVVFSDLGRPPSHLQYEVLDPGGRFVARTDFCWEDVGLVGEFDGRTKYLTLLRPGETPADVVIREKDRENAIRRLGWGVLRWDWNDLRSPSVLARRFDQAAAGRRSRG